MKILLSVSHLGFLRNIEAGLRELAGRGHQIHIAADRRDSLGGTRTLAGLLQDYPERVTSSYTPSPKNSRWHPLAITLRLCLDYWRYLDPRYDAAVALRARAARQVPPMAVWLGNLPVLGSSRAGIGLLRWIARTLERAIPPGAHAFKLVDEHAPDLLIVTPLLYFGSQQVDYVRAARRRGLPTLLCVGSWDHLTTKGIIHEIPDGLTVWNEAQRREAAEFHGIGPDRVYVTGAQAYDHWFAASPTLTREAFCAQIGVAADRPLLLYLCSSPFIAPSEVGPVKAWIEGIRRHPDPRLREAAILVRPHPQNAEQWKDVDLSPFGDVALWPRAGANPIDRDSRADYYHSMYFSDAVVGVNTSALIESGIVGRAVFSIRAPEFMGTQEGTLHFQHLKGVSGGLLSVADTFDEHYGQLVELLTLPREQRQRGRAFVESFVRPHGLDRPAAPIFADTIEKVGKRGKQAARGPSVASVLLRPLLVVLAAAARRLRGKKAEPKTDGEAAPTKVMRLMFVMQSPEYLRFFDDTLRLLADRGCHVTIAVDAQKEAKQARVDGLVLEHERLSFAGLVPRRGDRWAVFARKLRGTMDFLRYLDPRFEGTRVLRDRMKRKVLPHSLGWLDRVATLPPPVLRWTLGVLRVAEQAVPVSARTRAFLEAEQPDAVFVTPLVDAGSPQVDTIRAAQALGLPTAACIASWDNLTNKGLLRVVPDLVTVWNDVQKREAVEYHGIPAERVVVTGAQAFDRWFGRSASRSREMFCEMLALDPAKPIVLFTGSSFFISGEHTEAPFVLRWIAALRNAPAPSVRTANILIRPHPYNADQWATADLSGLTRVAVFPKGRHNPTDDQNRADFFDSLYYSAAVVGVNTSAMIEAAVVGRPVHAILTDDFAGTQEGTIHFRYLLPENGGFLQVARSMDAHVDQLARSLSMPDEAREETARFVRSFVRPNGVDRPAVPQLADALEAVARRGRVAPVPTPLVALVLRGFLAGPVALHHIVSRRRKGRAARLAAASVPWRKHAKQAWRTARKRGHGVRKWALRTAGGPGNPSRRMVKAMAWRLARFWHATVGRVPRMARRGAKRVRYVAGTAVRTLRGTRS